MDYLETWSGMEECVNKNLVKNIGVSNFNSQQVERLLASAKIKPVCNQVELNPNLNQKDLNSFCKKFGVILVAYCPLGRNDNGKPGSPVATILDEKVIEMGKKYKKSPAQVVLNYLVSNKYLLKMNFLVL